MQKYKKKSKFKHKSFIFSEISSIRAFELSFSASRGVSNTFSETQRGKHFVGCALLRHDVCARLF